MPPTAYVSNDVNSYTAIAAQPAVDTEGTTYVFAKYLSGAGMTHERTITEEREGGSGQDLTLAYVEHHVGSAEWPLYARPEIAARLLAYGLGYGTRTSAPSTLPYTHDITPVDQARLLTYEQYAPGAQLGERMLNSKITQLTMEGEHGKPIKIAAKIDGGGTPQNRDSASARTVTLETDSPFMFNLASHQLAVAGAYAGIDDITKWKVTFTRAVDGEVFGAGLGRQALPELNRMTEVEVTRRFQSAAAHRAVHYGGGSVGAATAATGAFKMYVADQGNGAASALRSFELEVPLMLIQTVTRNVYEPDGNTVYETLNAVGMRGATHLMRAVIQNATPTSFASGLL